MATDVRGSLNEGDNTNNLLKKEQDEKILRKKGMRKYFMQDDHFTCCNIQQSNFPCIGKNGLLFIRIVLLGIMVFVCYWAYITDYMDGFFL